ncbi:hypothetical protein HON22_03415 [Candidatus Peregrinibacteria bacterium]|jgi:hypothetical protein|nr:hypothetical protein [Candidatus Peregrinibacteria bacterium]
MPIQDNPLANIPISEKIEQDEKALENTKQLLNEVVPLLISEDEKRKLSIRQKNSSIYNEVINRINHYQKEKNKIIEQIEEILSEDYIQEFSDILTNIIKYIKYIKDKQKSKKLDYYKLLLELDTYKTLMLTFQRRNEARECVKHWKEKSIRYTMKQKEAEQKIKILLQKNDKAENPKNHLNTIKNTIKICDEQNRYIQSLEKEIQIIVFRINNVPNQVESLLRNTNQELTKIEDAFIKSAISLNLKQFQKIIQDQKRLSESINRHLAKYNEVNKINKNLDTLISLFV